MKNAEMLKDLQAKFSFNAEQMQTVEHGFNDEEIDSIVASMAEKNNCHVYQVRASFLLTGFQFASRILKEFV